MIVLREIAAAKVNLYLHVTGKRPDGLHELDSWVVFADVGDVVEAARADALTLAMEGPYAEFLAPGNNSVLAAAEALKTRYGVTAGASITLHKKLPVAAGIGGGSADAAAALRLLTRLWNINPREGEVTALAMALGSDVPACLRSRSVYMNGAGEQLFVAPQIDAWHAVLVNPGKPLSTKDVFEAYRERYSSAMRHPLAFASAEAGTHFLRHAKNDLEPAAQSLLPVIADVLAALDVRPGCMLARMSGSGATCFGIYKTREDAQNAADLLAKAYPEWWVQETRLK